LDRLTRSLRDLLPLLDLATEHGVGVTTVSGDLDLTTDMGRTLAGILASVAQGEVDRKGARQVLANAARAEHGRPSQGGRRPFGFEADGMTVREAEATWLRQAFDAFLAGGSLQGIATELNNDAGLTTVAGNRFNHNAVRHLLANARYAGIRVYRGTELGPAAWPAIVPEATYRAAAAKLADPGRRTNHTGSARRRLLTGVGLCGVCDDGKTTVLGGSGGQGMPLYQCSRRRHLMRAIDPVDTYVNYRVIDRLSRPDAIDLLRVANAPDLDKLMAERLAVVGRQQDAAAAFAAGEFTREQVRDINQRTNARIQEIDAELSDGNRERALGELVRSSDVRKTWEKMSLDRKQAALNALGTWTIGKGKSGGSSRNRYPTWESYNVSWTPAQGISR
jgi:hypothetical protein